jgi:hypothetical protein
MNRGIIILVIFLLVLIGCGGNRQSGNESEDFITVDVKATYPKKELILQDFMDVEYIALETTGEFLCQGIVVAVGKEIILVKNQLNDGDIFVFDRNGKGLRKINRKGRGGQEYLSVGEVILDEDNNEIFVNSVRKILVYDFFGNFKRSLPYNEGSGYSNICNFDKDNLICKDNSFDNEGLTGISPFIVISKHDGSISKHIQISIQQKRTNTKRINHNGVKFFAYTSNFPTGSVLPYHNGWILTVYSNDTVFKYLPDHSLLPFIVRTPSIELQNAEAFLSPGTLTKRYYFLQAEKMEPEVRGTNPMDAYVVFPKTNLMYDRQENAMFECKVYNDNFSNKMEVDIMPNVVNAEIAFWRKLEAYELVESLEKGQLKGELKEIAATLDAESNPVIMLVKFRE